MATLILAANLSGPIGRCDARCYNATDPRCDCVCGGLNHGVGYDKALQNTREHAAQLVKANHRPNPDSPFSWVEILGTAYRSDQPTLFPDAI